MATSKNYSPEELRRQAILILHKHLGALNTHRFLAQMRESREDYLKFQKRLFRGQSVDELYKAAKEHWQGRRRNRRK